MTIAAGTLLTAGFGVFLVGATAWRMVYQQPLAESLPVVHSDRRRRIWIHVWMIGGVVITSAGVGALASSPLMAPAATPAVIGVVVYVLGAGCMLVSLTFGLTVVPWAAASMVAHHQPPDVFPALAAWANALYLVHMLASYAAFAILGIALLLVPDVPTWLGWLGIGLGTVMTAGLTGTRFGGPFNPPILAHTFTATVGVVLLTL